MQQQQIKTKFYRYKHRRPTDLEPSVLLNTASTDHPKIALDESKTILGTLSRSNLAFEYFGSGVLYCIDGRWMVFLRGDLKSYELFNLWFNVI